MAFWNRRAEEDATSSPAPPAASLASRDVRNLIDACCARKAAVVVLCSDVGMTYNGRFQELRDDVIHIEVLTADPPAIKLLSLCVVTFNHGTRARVFLASVLGAELVGNTNRLMVQLPTEMIGAEGRFAFRVPVLDQAVFRVLVQHRGGELEVQPIDLSLTGIQIEVPEGRALDAAIDDPVVVSLDHPKHKITLGAVVRRTAGRRYGLFFPDTVQVGGRVDPPETLMALVREVELLWIRGRRDAEC